jgi:hypothetical protein
MTDRERRLVEIALRIQELEDERLKREADLEDYQREDFERRRASAKEMKKLCDEVRKLRDRE